MTRYERKRFFERLVELRALYRLRGSDDSVAEMSVDEAIGFAERLLAEAHPAEGVAPSRSERLGSVPPESVS